MSKLGKLALAAAAAMTVGCYVADPAPFDPRAMQQSERDRAREFVPPPKPPLPTTLESPYLNASANGETAAPTTAPATGPSLDNETSIRMSLQEITHLAVAHNLDVKVAGYNPAIDETRVTEAEARFDPTFFQNLSYTRTDQTNGFGFGTANAHEFFSQTGVRQNGESGGQFELRYETGWFEPIPTGRTSAVNPSRNQFWNNAVVLEVTQPLLRNFGNEINRARITVNRNTQRITLLEFRKQLEQSISDVEKTYWQLVAAERDVKIDEDLLDSTVHTADVLLKRIRQDVTRVQLSQANASIETRGATLIRAKAHVKDLSDQIKRLMNDPDMPVTSGVLILPASPPVEEPIRFDLKDQIDTALENRLELGEEQFKIDNADITYKVAKNNVLPRLDGIGSISVQGLDNQLGTAISQQVEDVNLSLSVGFQFEVPIGNREAEAILRRTRYQRDQEAVTYANLIEQVALDVKQAMREVDTTWDEMAATRQARFAQEDALLAIEQREQGGEALTPTFVQLKLDTQERLADAQRQEVDAVTNYNLAIAALERSKGTLLRYNNIVMEQDPIPGNYK